MASSKTQQQSKNLSIRVNSNTVLLLLLLVSCFFVLFWKLGNGPIRQWDESSLAVNALEMSLNHNFLVKYMGGEVDLINTKPPLLIWLIVACMSIFGNNEFALRLPSALAAFSTIVLVYAFSRSYLQDAKAGLIAGFVLISSIGFTGEHIGRTGDYDAMLVLWITIYSLSYFIYLNQQAPKKHTYLWITTAAMVLAILTKGIAGILVLPGIFIYTVYQRKIKDLLLTPQIYYSALIVLAFTLGYYVLTERYNPGYIQAVIANEITGRYNEVVEGGTPRGPLYYLTNMLSYRFVPWLYLLPVCFVVTQFVERVITKRFGMFGFFYLCCYFLIISASKSKFNWYDAPLYPIASLVIGIGISFLIRLIIRSFKDRQTADENQHRRYWFLSPLLILSLVLFPLFNNAYFEIYKGHVPYRENDQLISESASHYGNYLQQLASAQLNTKVKELTVINNARYNLPLLFYTERASLNSPYKMQVSWKTVFDQALSPNEVIVNCDEALKIHIESKYQLMPIHRQDSCATSIVVGEK